MPTNRGSGRRQVIFPAFQSTGCGTGRICLTESGLALDAVPDRAWAFAISFCGVLCCWLAARNTKARDATLQRGALDLVNRLAELLHWFDQADPVLGAAIANPLTRTQLHL